MLIKKKNLQIHITQVCDKDCSWCCLGIPLIKNPVHEDLEQLKKIAPVFPVLDTLIILGGEPTIHPQFDEICGWMSNQWKSTNKILLTNKPLGSVNKYLKWFTRIISNPIINSKVEPRNPLKVGSGLRCSLWCYERQYQVVERGIVYPCCSILGTCRLNGLDPRILGIPLENYVSEEISQWDSEGLKKYCEMCSVDTHFNSNSRSGFSPDKSKRIIHLNF